MESVKHRYQIPKLNSDFLKTMVLTDLSVKRSEARSKMIEGPGWGGKVLPGDFPTEEQVKRRIDGLKYLEKRKLKTAT